MDISASFFPNYQVSWMTLEQVFEIFITFKIIDGTRAIFTYLHGASLTVGPFWVRKLKKILENLTVLCQAFDQIDLGCWFEHLKKLN